MKAIYLDSVEILSEREVQKPQPGKGQVLIRVQSVGICGSDVHYWHKGKIGSLVVEEPMILGHECSGVIDAVGEGDVCGLQIGDRVVIEPGVPCYKCEYCLAGRYNLCAAIEFFATPPINGSLTEYVAHDANLVFKIPETIEDYGLATLAEPLAVGVFSTQSIRPKLGDKVIVFGAGVIGLACMLAAKASGCSSVVVADIREDRLKLARVMGADEVFNLKNTQLPKARYNIAYEATGADTCYVQLASCLKPGSKVATVGMGADMQTIPLVEFIFKEIMLVPTFRYANVYPTALDLLAANQKKLKSVITNRIPFSLEGVDKALHIALEDQTACKVIVDF